MAALESVLVVRSEEVRKTYRGVQLRVTAKAVKYDSGLVVPTKKILWMVKMSSLVGMGGLSRSWKHLFKEARNRSKLGL